jgi:hypothetical protein
LNFVVVNLWFARKLKISLLLFCNNSCTTESVAGLSFPSWLAGLTVQRLTFLKTDLSCLIGFNAKSFQVRFFESISIWNQFPQPTTLAH